MMEDQKILTEFDRSVLLWGETIQDFAARVLGDVGKWQELVAINGLEYPYTGEAPDPDNGIAGYGDALVIPRIPSSEVVRVEEDAAFGRDIALTAHGLLSSASGDLVMARGRANIKQALRHRVMTIPGELPYHNTYGCKISELKGDKMPRIASRLAAVYVQGALQMDDRVLSVPETTAVVDGDTVSVESTVITDYGRETIRTRV